MVRTDSRGFSLLPLVILLCLWAAGAGLLAVLTPLPKWACAVLGLPAAVLFIRVAGGLESLLRR
jgi:hypothetical protein